MASSGVRLGVLSFRKPMDSSLQCHFLVIADNDKGNSHKGSTPPRELFPQLAGVDGDLDRVIDC